MKFYLSIKKEFSSGGIKIRFDVVNTHIIRLFCLLYFLILKIEYGITNFRSFLPTYIYYIHFISSKRFDHNICGGL